MRKSKKLILKLVSLVLVVLVAASVAIPTVYAAEYRKAKNDVSSSYKGGRYYDNFTRVQLTGDNVTDVLALALSQLGYQEGNSAGQYSGTSGGSGNYTEYYYNFGDVTGNGYSMSWCAAFVSWALYQSKTTDHGKISDWCRNHEGDANYIWREISCPKWSSQLKTVGKYKTRASGYEPKSGDLIFFNRTSGGTTSIGHIGIVVWCDGSRVYTIEGNTSSGTGIEANGGGVYYKSYKLTNTGINGYGILPYKSNANALKVDYTGSKMTAGLYMVKTGQSLAVSSTAGGSTAFTVGAHYMFEVTGFSNGYAKVKYGTNSGYASLTTTKVLQVTATAEEEEDTTIKVNPSTEYNVGGTSIKEGFRDDPNVLVSNHDATLYDSWGLQEYGINKDLVLINGRTWDKWSSYNSKAIERIWIEGDGAGKFYMGFDLNDHDALKLKGQTGEGEELKTIVLKRGFKFVSTTKDTSGTDGALVEGGEFVSEVVATLDHNVILIAKETGGFDVAIDGVITKEYGKVTGDPVNIRSGPATTYDKYGQVHKDDELVYLGEHTSDDWYKVEYQGKTAWIMGSFFQLTGSKSTNVGTLDGYTVRTLQGIDVTGNPVNIRSGPSTSYDKYGKVYKGDILPYLGVKDTSTSDTWYKIIFEGREAWILGTFASINTSVSFYDINANNADFPHKHNYNSTDYDSNGYHWSVCACGATTDKESHDIVNNKCDECGYEVPKNIEYNDWTTTPAIQGWAYGETAKAPSYAAKFGTVKVKYTGTANDGTSWNSVSAPTKAGNYTVTFTVDATEDYTALNKEIEFSIEKAVLTVTAQDKTVTYGDKAPTYTVNITGWKNSENESSLGGELSFDCDYEQFDNTGAYEITPQGYKSSNYSFNYVDGTLTVNAKAATVTINAKTSVYGDEIVALTGTNDGFVNEDADVYELSTIATETASVGKYDIVGTAHDDNYIITFLNGTNAYEITAKELTVDVVVANKKYDGLNTATIASAKLVGIANEDNVGLVNGTATFNSVNVANDIDVALTAFTLSGDANVLKNYTLKQPTGIKANITNDWTPSEYIASQANSNGWLNKDFVITARDGYVLSMTNTASGVWNDKLVGATEGANNSITFYVRNNADGTISLSKTLSYKLDKTNPTGKVEFVGRKSWQDFVSNITFGLLYKDEVTVKAEASDALSGIASIEYASSNKAMSLDEVKAITNWTSMPTNGVGVTAEDSKKFVYFVRITDKAGNVTYLSTDGAEYDTAAPVISGIENGKTYYDSQSATVTDKNLDTVMFNGQPVTGNINLEGNKNATYTISASDKAGNVTTVTVTMKPIVDIGDALDGITEDNVKSTNKDTIDEVVDAANKLLEKVNLSNDEKTALEDVKGDAKNLLDKLEEVAAATETEKIKKVENVTSQNVILDNKKDLNGAKDDFEKALEDNSGNYTEQEKQAIKDEIKNIEAALKVISNVENVEKIIGELPKSITKNDEAAVNAASEAYEALSEYEKTLVFKDTKMALDNAKAELAKLLKPAETTSPSTNDNNNLWLWFALLLISSMGIFGVTLGNRKRRIANK